MTLQEAMARLQSLGNEKMREMNAKNGAGDNQFGVKMGDLRVVAKEAKTDHDLALALWETGNADARLLSTLIIKPKLLTKEQVDSMVRQAGYSQLADWVATNITKLHPEKEDLRQQWMTDKEPLAARAGWSLTAERVIKNPEGLDLKHLLDRIEKEMGNADPLVQWTMNYTLAEIGINFPEHRDRAIAIGERLGVFRNYPVSKGCTSPFAPIWITEQVKRQA